MEKRKGKMRILIADDDRVSREIIFITASDYGKCDLAINGVEAVEAFSIAHSEGKPYDLVLLDIMMPLFEGNKVIRKIRSFEDKKGIICEKRIKAVIISALLNPKLIEELSEFEIYEYIKKPISIAQLKKVLDSLGTRK